MTALEFLRSEKTISMKHFAALMWPDNNNPHVKMSMKLREKDGRKWTAKDEARAIVVLRSLGKRIDEVL